MYQLTEYSNAMRNHSFTKEKEKGPKKKKTFKCYEKPAEASSCSVGKLQWSQENQVESYYY